ncbi:MAG: hypothetical protein HND44_05245 [Chloroflexi bacterium]|nr:hypothetical protein [Ardenticatenaceae bacterium]NOG33969.1 hypothetical protein [Chloroflexota bacterium]GIK55654.1 MAG: hypothetical protein BroJett015_13170 [Chloroflexota bacterium]
MNHQFPAILIGGPPHSGKSVLIYSLTRALREARISHYVLRACPDGEGDWAYQLPQDQVRAIRVKGEFTPQFTQRVISYLQHRPLPLLVDVGGKPTPEQEEIFAHCTQAILLIGHRADDPGAFARDLQTWQEMMARQQVPVMRVIQSDLQEADRLQVQKQRDDVKSLSALHRGTEVHGPVFETIMDELAVSMSFPERTLAAIYKAQLPDGVAFIDLPHLAGKLGDPERYWQPDDLPYLLEQLPADQPIAVYGRSANWIYAVLALATRVPPFTMFDAKLGWVTPPTLPRRAHQPGLDDWQTHLVPQGADFLLEMNTGSQYLDIDEPERIPLPPVPEGTGLILSGRIPHWLVVAVCQQLAATQSWVAVYQPAPLQAALVVASQWPDYPVGRLILWHTPAAKKHS